MTNAVHRQVRVVLALLLLLIAGTADASTVVFRTDAELIALADRIVHAKVIRQRTERPDPDGAIYTVSTLAIVEDFTGVAGLELEAWELGGSYGGESMWVGGGVGYDLGSTVLVCLERGRFGYRSVAMGFSKFDVEPSVAADGTLDGRLSRNERGVSIVGAPAVRKSELSLAGFRDLATQLRGVQPRRNREAESMEAEQNAFAGFTLLGSGFRWTEADSGVPVNWYINTSAPNPLLSGDAVAEVQLAMTAWTAPASATIVLQYVGTTNQATAKGPWSGVGNGSGVITFEDPNNELSGSTLAIGGGFGASGGGTVNGTTFLKFTRAYVIWQNAADLSSSFRQSTNFARVMEHEIGHTIGLGHSELGSANVMHPSCCASNSPVSPALGPDDLAGLDFIYPSGTTGPPPPPPPSCSYSISPTSASATASGGSGTVNVTAGTGCTWTAAVTSGALLSLTGSTTGSGNGAVGYAVTANSTTFQRSGTLAIAGQTFTVTQAAAACAYTLSAGSATAGIAGGAATVTVTTSANCPWTAATSDSFLSVTSGSSVMGSGTVGYSVAPNGAVSFRVGTITIAGQTFVVTQAGSGPAMSVDKPALNFGAVTNGSSFVSQTTTQTVRLSQAGSGTVTWTAASNVPWLAVSPASGTGAAALNVSVAFVGGLPAAGTRSAAVTLTFTGAGSPSGAIAVDLRLYQPGASGAAFGAVDTPADNIAGVAGSIAVTGWALDDVEVTQVRILRDPVAGEGAGLIPIGVASFVDGSRPDAAGLFPGVPRRTRGGWGYLMLTNFLPNLGNGTVRLHVYADDADGHTSLVGSRTITCANATSTAPFGAIDSPAQGETVSGVINNFGWVLSRGPAIANPPGGTVTVLIDGGPAGSPGGWTTRSDLAALFPAASFPGITGALGVASIDTTRLANGIHTLAWVVTASDGQSAGIGSRYFIVQNASAPVTESPDPSPIVEPRAGVEATIDIPLGATAIDRGDPLRIGGWAIDPGAESGTGVSAIHVWAHPTDGGQPLFLGVAAYGGTRPDVGAIYGTRFTKAGYDLVAEGLPPGTYDIAVFAWSTVLRNFAPARVVRITIR